MDSYDDYLPCYIKSERDGSATTMLLGLSSSECPREIGDHSGFVASNTKIKQNRWAIHFLEISLDNSVCNITKGSGHYW